MLGGEGKVIGCQRSDRRRGTDLAVSAKVAVSGSLIWSNANSAVPW